MTRVGVFGRILKQKALLIFIIPAFVSVLVFNYAPLFGIIMAFQNYDILKGYGGSSFVGFSHFKEFLVDPEFYSALKNTLGINIVSLLVCFPLVIIFALLMNELAYVRFKKVVQTVTYLPHFVSWVVIAGLVYKMLDQDTGIFNILREALGMERIGFLREPQYFWTILIVVTILKEISWNTIIFMSAMTNIDPTLYEAGMVDGAGRLRRIWHITLPGIMPTVGVILILTAGSIFSLGGGGTGTLLPNFDAIYNMYNAMVWKSANVIDLYSLTTGVRQGRYSYAAAIGLSQSVIALILVYFSNKLAKKVSDPVL